jgi:hypothetical protein
VLITLLFLKIASVATAIASISLAFLAPKGRAGMALVGSLTTCIGIIGITSGKISQRWGGGPPLEGSFAAFGSLVLLAFGLVIIFFAFKKPDEQTQTSDE